MDTKNVSGKNYVLPKDLLLYETFGPIYLIRKREKKINIITNIH